ncbi:MAG: hypothetical protein IPG71_02430 [bacterium]|nr:hypothetical protein [bacterium]
MMKTFLTFVLVALLAACSFATIIEVPGDAVTIQSAHNTAASGDTVLLGPGTFTENLVFTKKLILIGSGFSTPALCRLAGQLRLNSGSSGTTIEGLRIEHSSHHSMIISATVDSIVLRRMLISDMATGYSTLVQYSSGSLLIKDCALLHVYAGGGGQSTEANLLNSGGGAVVIENCLLANANTTSTPYRTLQGTYSSLVVANCSFVGPRTLLGLNGSFPFAMINCVFHDWNTSNASWGTYPPTSTIDYCSSTGTVPPIGTNFIQLANDPFVNYDETANYQFGVSNLHLDPVNGVACINAGDPNVLDLDGSRSDLGIYGGQTPFVDSGAPNYPYVQSLTVPGAVTFGGELQIQSQGRIGRGY